jgi:hypothetical protein
MSSILKQRDRISRYTRFISPSDKEQIVSLTALIEQLDVAEKQIQLLQKQVTNIKKEAVLLDRKNQEIYKPIFIEIDDHSSIFHKQLQPIHKAVTTIVDRTITNLNNTGALAIDRISEVTNIKERLSQLMQKIDTSISSINDKIKRIENISNDFRNTTTQIKNFARSLFGKIPIAEQKKQGRITKSIMVGLKNITIMQDRLQHTIVGVFCKIDDLQKVAKGLHMDKSTTVKESVSSKLKEYRKEKVSKEQSSYIEGKFLSEPNR